MNEEKEPIEMHVHDNDAKLRQCLLVADLLPGRGVTIHFHAGPCQPCPQGHCHDSNVTIVMTDEGKLYVSLEGTPTPSAVTIEEHHQPHAVVGHNEDGTTPVQAARFYGRPLPFSEDVKRAPVIMTAIPKEGGH